MNETSSRRGNALFWTGVWLLAMFGWLVAGASSVLFAWWIETGRGWGTTLPSGSWPDLREVGWNLLLMLLFCGTHSLLARPRWKRAWSDRLPAACERPFYVAVSGVTLLALVLGWQQWPVVLVAWTGWPALLLTGLRWFGWALIFAAGANMRPGYLLGVQQLLAGTQGRSWEPLPLQTTGLFRYVRHPTTLGQLITLWASAPLALDRACLALMMSLYLGIAMAWEERDLISEFGADYRAYAERTPRLIPWRIVWPVADSPNTPYNGAEAANASPGRWGKDEDSSLGS